MVLLFLHGAGGYDEDRLLADAIAAELGQPLEYPRLPDDDMSLAHHAGLVRTAVGALAPDDVVVAHSFGATVLLHVLAERAHDVPRSVTLLAMPDWNPEGWDVAEYAFTGPEPGQAISLHHCRDDEVVEFSHLALNARRLPHAVLHMHDSGGHQFVGLEAEVALAQRIQESRQLVREHTSLCAGRPGLPLWRTDATENAEVDPAR